MTHWSDKLPPNACGSAVAWCRTQPSLAVAWQKCQRGDWMLWLVGKFAGKLGSVALKPLVACTCDCAELSAHLADSDTQMTIAWCLTIARDWAAGGISTLNDVQAAEAAVIHSALAVRAVSAAAAHSALAAAASAVQAASTASAARFAVSAAADAAYAIACDVRTAGSGPGRILAECADIVREHYPKPPVTDHDEIKRRAGE